MKYSDHSGMVYPSQRFYFLNVLEELDQPGEWFLDTASGVLYFWPPEDGKLGDAAERLVSGHHRRRLRAIGWERALDPPPGPPWRNTTGLPSALPHSSQ